jgi:probable rRNA maturation factor
MSGLTVNIGIASAQWTRAFPGMKKKIGIAAEKAFLKSKKPATFRSRPVQVNILLTTDSKIRTLNRDFRGMDKPTNVLSFPAAAPIPGVPMDALPAGDVVLALQTIRRECRAQNKTLESHTIHLIVHGILHLFGYDHLRQKDAKSMEKLECDILKSLGYPDPYVDPPVNRRSKAHPHGRRV